MTDVKPPAYDDIKRQFEQEFVLLSEVTGKIKGLEASLGSKPFSIPGLAIVITDGRRLGYCDRFFIKYGDAVFPEDKGFFRTYGVPNDRAGATETGLLAGIGAPKLNVDDLTDQVFIDNDEPTEKGLVELRILRESVRLANEYALGLEVHIEKSE